MSEPFGFPAIDIFSHTQITRFGICYDQHSSCIELHASTRAFQRVALVGSKKTAKTEKWSKLEDAVGEIVRGPRRTVCF